MNVDRMHALRTFAFLFLLLSPAAKADSQTFKCVERGGGEPVPLSLTYEGDAEGMMTLSAPFGSFALPASKTTIDGQSGINAKGVVHILMPERAALERCVLEEAREADGDQAIAALASCRWSVPLNSTPIDAKVSVSVLMIDGVVMTELQRTYLDKSRLFNGTLSVEAIPPMECEIAK